MIRIVTFGDSVTRGARPGVEESETFSSLLEIGLRARGMEIEVINRGIGGEDTAGALERLDEIIALQPDIVTVMYGINDAAIDEGSEAPRLSSVEFGKNLTAILRHLRQAGIQSVVWTSNPMSAFGITKEYYADRPPYSTHGDINFMLVHYIAEMKRATAAEGLPVLDVYAAFAAKADATNDLQAYLTDGMHPNPAGHRLIAEILLEHISSLLVSMASLSGDRA